MIDDGAGQNSLRAQELERAMTLLSAGQSAQAGEIFRNTLRTDINDADALHGLACVARQSGKPDLAIAMAGKAIASRSAPHFHITLGMALTECGHVQEGLAAVRTSVLMEPRDPRAHAALAGLCERVGDFETSVNAWREAVRLRPLQLDYKLALARCLRNQSRLDEALLLLSGILRAAPDNVAALQEKALVLTALGQSAQALEVFTKVADHLPDDAAAAANHGAALFAVNRHAEALLSLRRSEKLAPDIPETLSTHGLVLMALGYLTDAREKLLRAHELSREDVRISLNLGTILTEFREFEAASSLFRDVLARTGATSPDFQRAQFNLATILLAQGEWRDGWKMLEIRRDLLAPSARPDLPLWDGASLVDGPLLIEAEQGIGDLIQFLRFVPMAAQRVPVILCVPGSMKRLASRLLSPWPVTVVMNASEIRDATARCAILSLPHLLEVDGITPCLSYGQQPLAKREAGERKLRVGLCWAGNTSYRFDARRSIPLVFLEKFARHTNIDFVSLQHGFSDEYALPFPIELMKSGDFEDTARIIESLDLVISVDTAVAHLAGSVGVPVWMLNRFGGDWRWAEAHQVPGDDNQAAISAWYPSMRIWQIDTPDIPTVTWERLTASVSDALDSLSGK